MFPAGFYSVFRQRIEKGVGDQEKIRITFLGSISVLMVMLQVNLVSAVLLLIYVPGFLLCCSQSLF